jgi:elongation factor G
MQLPIGGGDDFAGVIDLATMQAMYFDGDFGETVRREAIPATLTSAAEAARRSMLESLAMYSDEMMELLLSEDAVPEALIHHVTRDAAQQQDATPVFLGAAYRNKGVQPLLDAIIRYLPSPLGRRITANRCDGSEEEIVLEPTDEKPFVGMAFKIVDDPFGQLTFLRVYQGAVSKGRLYVNQRTGRKERFSRIVRIHADKREEIERTTAGDIVAVMGIEGASGDTYAEQRNYCTLESMFVPDPVIKVSVAPASRGDGDKLAKALARFRKEDPTFRVIHDGETGEILLAGMGELHLEVYVERIRREYNVQVEVGRPKVSYREAPQTAVPFDYKLRKQTGGAGQYAHIVGGLSLLSADAEEPFVFEEHVVGGRIPKQYLPSIEKGFRDALGKGPLAGYPVEGVRITLEDGSYHEVDSSDKAFRTAARECFRAVFPKTKPVLLEPIMRMEIEFPLRFQGAVTGDLTARRGVIVATSAREGVSAITADAPLAETFGYATDLRSMTQGQGSFTMELNEYRRTPVSVQEMIVAERRKEQLVGAR